LLGLRDSKDRALGLTDVCALHEQQRTPLWKLIKKSKNTN
jgi:hypothetical protein